MMAFIQSYAVPAIVLSILIFGLAKNVKVFDAFIEGAKEGIETTIAILPPLMGLFTAIGVLRASGVLDAVIGIARPVAELIGIPPELVPLVILRPISGSASLAFITEIMKIYGPDSYLGLMASTMMGSTETIFYTLTIYFGSVGIKRPGYALTAALISDAAGVVSSVLVCKALFG